MRLIVNMEKRRHPQWHEVMGIFMRPQAKGFSEEARPSQSALDGPSQKAVFFAGMNQGLFFNFIYADDLKAALKTASALEYKWVYVVNGAYFTDYLDIREWIAKLEESPEHLMSLHQARPSSIGPAEVYVANAAKLLQATEAGKVEFGKNGRIKIADEGGVFQIPGSRIQFSEQFARPGRHADPFATVFTTGNEVPDASECRRFTGRKIDVLITPGSGFFVNNLIGVFGNDVGAVSFYDASTRALEYKKRVNEQWSPGQPLPRVDESAAAIDDRMVPFNEKIFPTPASVADHWSIYKDLPKTYTALNLIENPEALAALVPAEGRPFLWLSNIYTYSMNVQLHSLDDIQYSFLHLIRLVRKKNPGTIVGGRMPSGRYVYDYAPDVYLGLSNFNFF